VKPQIVVLISGGGTNLKALIDAIKTGVLEAEICLVVSNRKEAYGLERARNAKLETLYAPLKPYRDAGKTREEYDADLATSIARFKPDLIVQAGWMHILSPAFLDQFPRRVINLHPALPGEFDGANAIARAWEAHKKSNLERSGAMIHWVIPKVDAGEVIISREIEFLENDTLESFEARLHVLEHQLIVEGVRRALESLFTARAASQ
jgi:formyltetrahydrofolate-dependent phosphoribosylglycinamide formyltransferase